MSKFMLSYKDFLGQERVIILDAEDLTAADAAAQSHLEELTADFIRSHSELALRPNRRWFQLVALTEIE